ncbi:MAG: TauD/TfdA family dioxygenase [bacterium]|nr:hypothetical protein [Deltaproteobacteria bacterium]MCP4904704.1 TauD/TfdA family dioxygenase [bacterium]
MFKHDPTRAELAAAAGGSDLAPVQLLAHGFGGLFLTDTLEAYSSGDIARLHLATQDYGAVLVRSREVPSARSFESFGDRFVPMMQHLDREGIPQYPLEGCSKISVLLHNTASLKANAGARLFHHDGWGHSPIDPGLSMLMAAAIPMSGGSTLIADARAAYDWLSPGLKNLVDHATVVSRMAREHVEAEKAEGRKRADEFEHPLVCHNPVSGRKSLIISDRTVCIKGWSRQDSAPLLNHLQQHAIQAQLCLRHMWQVGDVLIWDDRWVKHAGASDVLEASERELWRLVASINTQTGEFLK